MNNIPTRLLNKQLLAQDTVGLWLEKPSGFVFQAGQTIDVGIPGSGLEDYEAFRELTVASSPADNQLLVVYRDRDSLYKQVMKDLELESELWIRGPYGQFILHPDELIPAVFLAGGIGVAPFRSMIEQSLEIGSKRALYLFYSNHSIPEATFFKEFNAWSREYSLFHFIPTFTAPIAELQGWAGEMGYISNTMIRKYLPTEQGVFYICGSPDMVRDLYFMLETAGVDKRNIRTESFTGY